jgi:integrase/recombinase XerC
LELGISKVTINNDLSRLRAIFNYCKLNHVFPSYIAEFKLFHQESNIPLALSYEEKLLLINSIKKKIPRIICALCFYTGCRISEMLNIKIKNLNLATRELTITNDATFKTKNSNTRIIPLNEVVFQLFTQIVAEMHMEVITDVSQLESYLFLNPQSGKPYTRWYVSSVVKATMRELGFSDEYKFHSTRHTFATDIANSGTPRHVLKELMGHLDDKSTEVYLHVYKEDKQKAVALLK